MKSLTDYLVFEEYQKGIFKKGMKVVMVYGDAWPKDENWGKSINGKFNTTVEKIKVAEVEKVVSKDNGRYSGDQHTWIYVDSIRFECFRPDLFGYDAELDRYSVKNKSVKDQYIIIFTKESFKKFIEKDGLVKDDRDTHKFDLSKIDKEELNKALEEL